MCNFVHNAIKQPRLKYFYSLKNYRKKPPVGWGICTSSHPLPGALSAIVRDEVLQGDDVLISCVG